MSRPCVRRHLRATPRHPKSKRFSDGCGERRRGFDDGQTAEPIEAGWHARARCMPELGACKELGACTS